MSADETRRLLTWQVPDDHPAFAGHFPGHPILPGVVLLDEALLAAREWVPAATRWEVTQAKFLQPVLPGQHLQLQLTQQASAAIAFEFLHEGVPVAQGRLVPHHGVAPT